MASICVFVLYDYLGFVYLLILYLLYLIFFYLSLKEIGKKMVRGWTVRKGNLKLVFYLSIHTFWVSNSLHSSISPPHSMYPKPTFFPSSGSQPKYYIFAIIQFYFIKSLGAEPPRTFPILHPLHFSTPRPGFSEALHQHYPRHYTVNLHRCRAFCKHGRWRRCTYHSMAG